MLYPQNGDRMVTIVCCDLTSPYILQTVGERGAGGTAFPRVWMCTMNIVIASDTKHRIRTNRKYVPANNRTSCCGNGSDRPHRCRATQQGSLRYWSLRTVAAVRLSRFLHCIARCIQGGYIFYAGGSLAGAGYCRHCRRRRPSYHSNCGTVARSVKIFAQRLPRVAQFNACWVHIGLLALSGQE